MDIEKVKKDIIETSFVFLITISVAVVCGFHPEMIFTNSDGELILPIAVFHYLSGIASMCGLLFIISIIRMGFKLNRLNRIDKKARYSNR